MIMKKVLGDSEFEKALKGEEQSEQEAVVAIATTLITRVLQIRPRTKK